MGSLKSIGVGLQALRVWLRNRAGWLALLGFWAVFPILLVAWATRWGIGVGYDSYLYLTAAENLRLGHGLGRFTAEGLWAPLIHYPPMYPITLSLIGALPWLDLSEAARFLSALLLGVNSLGLAALVSWAGGRRWAGLLAAALFVSAPILLRQHLWAMSESLFFSLMLAFLFCLTRYQLETTSRRWLIGTAVLGSLAYLTRYAALALLAAGILVIFLQARRSWRKGLKHAALYAGFTVSITVPWLLRNAALTGSLTNRNLRFHPLNLEQIKQAGRTLAGWIGPTVLPQELRLALVIMSIAAIMWFAGRNMLQSLRASISVDREGALQVGILAIAVFYPLALLFSLSFFDASTRLNDRILSPLFLCFLVLATLTLAPFVERLTSGGRWASLIVLLTFFLVPLGFQSAQLVTNSRQRGLGFNSQGWRESATVQAVQKLPAGALIYSNESFPLSYRTTRRVFPVPERFDPVLAAEREDYQAQLGTMRNRLVNDGGYLVLFHPNRLRVEMPSLAELTEGMILVESFSDGKLYQSESYENALQSSEGR